MIDVNEILSRQWRNLREAYEMHGIKYEKLATDPFSNKKLSMLDLFGGKHTLAFEVPLSKDEIQQSEIAHELSTQLVLLFRDEWRFSLVSATATRRSDGHCMRLSKFLTQFKPELLPLCKQLTSLRKTLIITCHPWFLAGSSVIADGHRLNESCHHPGSNSDYVAGPTSYAVDGATLAFIRWGGNGIVGRQLVFVPDERRAFATARRYGRFLAADSAYLVDQMKQLMNPDGDWGRVNPDNYPVIRNDFTGYMDEDDEDWAVWSFASGTEMDLIQMASPVCPNCGMVTDGSELNCEYCRPLPECPHCRTEVQPGEGYHFASNTVCPTCFAELYELCDHCGQVEPRTAGYLLHVDGNTFCSPWCAGQAGYKCCAECGTFHPEIEVTQILTRDGRQRFLCNRCFPWVVNRLALCPDCGTLHEGRRDAPCCPCLQQTPCGPSQAVDLDTWVDRLTSSVQPILWNYVIQAMTPHELRIDLEAIESRGGNGAGGGPANVNRY